MVPVARAGLAAIGIDADESDYYLGIIEERLALRQSGAVWQQRKLAQLRETLSEQDALHALLEAFMEHAITNLPVARWSL